MQVSGVEDDSRALNIVIHKPSSNPHAKPLPILQANFIFADHIRCIIAKQRLAKGRIQARRMKMQRIAGEYLEIRLTLCGGCRVYIPLILSVSSVCSSFGPACAAQCDRGVGFRPDGQRFTQRPAFQILRAIEKGAQ